MKDTTSPGPPGGGANFEILMGEIIVGVRGTSEEGGSVGEGYLRGLCCQPWVATPSGRI